MNFYTKYETRNQPRHVWHATPSTDARSNRRARNDLQNHSALSKFRRQQPTSKARAMAAYAQCLTPVIDVDFSFNARAKAISIASEVSINQ